jgi:hypothetical protein
MKWHEGWAVDKQVNDGLMTLDEFGWPEYRITYVSFIKTNLSNIEWYKICNKVLTEPFIKQTSTINFYNPPLKKGK